MAAPAADKEGKEAKGKDGRFLVVDNVTTSLFQSGMVLGSMRADFVLDVTDPKKREFVQSQIARVRAGAHTVLLDYANRQYRPDTVVNADAIRAHIQQEVDRQLGPDMARVYLTFLIVHGR